MVNKISKAKIDRAWQADFRPSVSPKSAISVRGYDFSKKFDFGQFLASYTTTGFQATNLGLAINTVRAMRAARATIFLAYNSNMVSSGLREVIAWLVKNRLVHVLVTTAGGVEEDIIKTLKPFVLGDFRADGAKLRQQGINRIGNIFVPNDRYIAFEKLMRAFLDRLYDRQVRTGQIISASQFIHELGKEVSDRRSIYYWATRNNIPCFCPALTDGAIGDMIFFFKQHRPDFKVDIADDMVRLVGLALEAKKTGIILLGGGFVKHHVCNANVFRNGADYAVYITTETEEGGSDSGARPDEAVSWGKIKAGAPAVKVCADATLAFPLLVAGAFANRI